MELRDRLVDWQLVILVANGNTRAETFYFPPFWPLSGCLRGHGSSNTDGLGKVAVILKAGLIASGKGFVAARK